MASHLVPTTCSPTAWPWMSTTFRCPCPSSTRRRCRALALSFALLALARRTPGEGSGRAGRTAMDRFARASPRTTRPRARARARVARGSVATALFGSTEPSDNPAPNLVFVLGWIGLPIAALLLGRGVLELHPIAALARTGGMRETRPGVRSHDPGGSGRRGSGCSRSPGSSSSTPPRRTCGCSACSSPAGSWWASSAARCGACASGSSGSIRSGRTRACSRRSHRGGAGAPRMADWASPPH